jgi:hypothetical protein
VESYKKELGLQPAFEVKYRFLTQAEGGRSAPLYQHIRWDFLYEGDNPQKDGVWMIWPEFLDQSGRFLPDGEVPTSGQALMFIVVPESTQNHKKRIALGTKGFFVEGSRKIAECEVTAIHGLANEDYL